MKHRLVSLSSWLRRVLMAKGNVLARLYRLCYSIRFSGISSGVSMITGLVTCNISFRAGESGRVHHLSFLLLRDRWDWSCNPAPGGILSPERVF